MILLKNFEETNQEIDFDYKEIEDLFLNPVSCSVAPNQLEQTDVNKEEVSRVFMKNTIFQKKELIQPLILSSKGMSCQNKRVLANGSKFFITKLG